MKIFSYCWCLLVLMLSCSEVSEEVVNVKEYICPIIDEPLYYEFENSNSAILPIRFLALERDETEPDKFIYSFLNEKKEIVNAYVERRNRDSTSFVGMTIQELNPSDQSVYYHQLKFDAWKIPYALTPNTLFNFSLDYPSHFQRISYKYRHQRKLSNSSDFFLLEDTSIPTIAFDIVETTDIIKTSNQEVEHTIQSLIKMTYAKGVGIVKMEMNIVGYGEFELKLRRIHNQAAFDALLDL